MDLPEPGPRPIPRRFRMHLNSSVLISNGHAFIPYCRQFSKKVLRTWRQKGVQAGYCLEVFQYSYSSGSCFPGTVLFLSEFKPLILIDAKAERLHLAKSMREAMCFVN